MEQGRDTGGHRYFEEMAMAHVLGGLDEADGRVFRSHLLECPLCRAQVGELRAIAHSLADAEREERRVRASKAIDTKRRTPGAEDEPPPAERARTSLAPRVLLVAGLLAIMVLSAWNFTLRGTVAGLRQLMERRTDQIAVLELGSAATVTLPAGDADVRGSAKVLDGRLALVVDGLEDDAAYGVYVLDADGTVRVQERRQATGGRLLDLLTLPPDGHSVLVTRLTSGAMAAGVTGTPVFAAEFP